MSVESVGSVPAWVETCPDDRDKGWQNDVQIEVKALVTSDPIVTLSFYQCRIELTAAQTEVLETALRVARQSIRPRR